MSSMKRRQDKTLLRLSTRKPKLKTQSSKKIQMCKVQLTLLETASIILKSILQKNLNNLLPNKFKNLLLTFQLKF